MDVAESFSKQKPKDKLSRYSLNSLQKGECELPVCHSVTALAAWEVSCVEKIDYVADTTIGI